MNEFPVAIVGAGPVGLVLAMDLAQRGVPVVVLEMRHRGEPPNVKCNHVAARSMEVFRRLGVAQAVRASGLPPDYPHSISYRTATTGREVTRIHIPARQDRFTDHSGPDGHWPTPEPPHRINQLFLEPLLFEHAAAQPGITIHNRVEVESLSQDDDGVTLQVRRLDGGEVFALRARWVAGCDGGRSKVRRSIGATLSGDAVVQRVQSTFIRAPKLIGQMREAPVWAMFSVNPRRSGNVYSIDGRETWLVHNYLREDEPEFDSVDRDRCLRDILGVDKDFEYSVISLEDWVGRRLVADRFRDRRVFLCGDAAHLWVPYAGYGMNAGIADAVDLGWMLAAVEQGWGDVRMLDAYEAERLPITEQVSRFAMNHAHAMTKRRRSIPPDIEEEGPAAEASRRAFGQDLYDLNVQQYCCAGLNFGYYYDRSPLIVPDGEAPPAYGMGHFTPSTVPGCRAPHFWLSTGESLLDALGTDHAVLRRHPGEDCSALQHAAAAVGLPLRVIDLPVGEETACYRHRFTLIRPDGQVAWRSDRLDTEGARALVDILRGARTAPSATLG